MAGGLSGCSTSINIDGDEGKKLSELVDSYRSKYFISGEINTRVSSVDPRVGLEGMEMPEPDVTAVFNDGLLRSVIATTSKGVPMHEVEVTFFDKGALGVILDPSIFQGEHLFVVCRIAKGWLFGDKVFHPIFVVSVEPRDSRCQPLKGPQHLSLKTLYLEIPPETLPCSFVLREPVGQRGAVEVVTAQDHMIGLELIEE